MSLVGHKLAHYRVLELLGQGGMGAVYRAEDTRLGREVALKVLPDAVSQDPDRLSRFRREARAVASLNHPGIVTVHSVEEHAGTPFITMELVEGEMLNHSNLDSGMNLDAFYPLAEQLADAVAAAHAKGIVHRDLKPANIMVTPEGRAKVLDFGLARIDEVRSANSVDEAPTQTTTQIGLVLGTPSYMSPEQARGEAADARSDIFALGVVFYEMLSARRLFRRADGPSTIHAILNDEPPEIIELRPDVPAALATIISRCLAKAPEERYASATELGDALAQVRPVPVAAGRPPWLAVLAAVVPLVVVAALGMWWQGGRQPSGERLRDQAIPRIEALIDDGNYTDAFLEAREVLASVPDDPALLRLLERCSWPGSVTTEPPGARVEFRRYDDPEQPWTLLGTSPINEIRLPSGYSAYRFTLDGYETELRASGMLTLQVRLQPNGSGPEGMVRVPAGEAQVGPVATSLPAFWIDRSEVTNEEYQAFVDAGGYEEASYWQEPFVDGARTLERDEALAQFVDATGRPGPAGWELGRYPKGDSALPVSGVSWYEAAAYARWSGKQLPTVFHWTRAAGRDIFAEILELSNFESDGPDAVGSRAGIGPFGTYDMAGNVKEWCANASGDLRYSQGGGWNEASYVFNDNDARSPFERAANQGFRLAHYDEPPAAELFEPWQDTRFDFNEIEPVDDEHFAFITSIYDYEPLPLEPEVEQVDDSPEHWRLETVSVDPAYAGPRLLLHLYFPKNASPPYQTVVFRPSSVANWLTRIEDYSTLPGWLPRSGRVLVVPEYWGTFSRKSERRETTPALQRERMVRQVRDYRRTLDYLATRDDIDFSRVAYGGLSAGGEYAPLYLALDDRVRAAVVIAAGFHDTHMLDEPDEIRPWNFSPRVTLPTLLINGENDFTLPYKKAQIPFFEMLGTPKADKRMILIEGGHVTTDRNALIRESLAWLDEYLGPVADASRARKQSSP